MRLAGLIAVREDLPSEPVDESELIDAIAAAGQRNANIERENEHRQQRAQDIQRSRNKVGEYKDQAAAFRKKAEEMDSAAVALEAQIETDVASLESAGSIGKPIDVVEVRTKLTRAQTTNAEIKANDDARAKKAGLERVAADAALLSDQLTGLIAARNKLKDEAIAGAQMPVPGLGFGNGYITLNGVPFDQASDAERLRTSCAIAMKLNARLRVIRVRDGSLLDDNSMAILAEMAAENDCQIWIETVRAVTDAAVIITDGRVKGAVVEESAA